MADIEQRDPEWPPPKKWPLALSLIAALVIGTIGGGALGYAAHAMFAEPAVVIPPPKVIKEQITDEDLTALCQDLTDEQKSKVLAVQSKVAKLQQQLQAKEAELDKLHAQVQKNEKNRAAALKKWKAMVKEIAELRLKLAKAEQERDELKAELQETLVKLDKQIRETNKFKRKAKRYKKEATANLWQAFVADAKVQICDRGTRKRHARCHQAVDAAMTDAIRDRFTTCVDTYQAVPVLKQAPKSGIFGSSKRDSKLPAFAEWLPDDNKFTNKGWYIIFCDPTLPEAGVDHDLDDVDLTVPPADTPDDLGPSSDPSAGL